MVTTYYTKRSYLLMFTAVVLLSEHVIAMENEESEAKGVYEKAIMTTPRIAKIHQEGLERREAESCQLTKLLECIVENQTMDHEKLRTRVIESLNQDKVLFDAVNKKLKLNQNIAGQKGATYQLLVNKMPFITAEALKLVEDETIFFGLLEGTLPQGYSITPPEFNYFPNKDHIYSNGRRGNALKSLMLKIWQIQNEKSLSQLDLFGPSWLDEASFVHITPLPDDFDGSSIQSWSHFYSDDQTPMGLLTINNGYAFGGHRLETRYPQSKPWGPHDCSSFVVKYTNCKNTFATVHQAQYFQQINGFQFKDLVGPDIIKQWNEAESGRKNDDCIKAMAKVLRPLGPNQQDPQSLKPGLVHAERAYRNVLQDHKVALNGTGGHTGIYLGTIGSAGDTKALTVSADRDLENTGKEFICGVEKRPFFTSPERMIMFFDDVK